MSKLQPTYERKGATIINLETGEHETHTFTKRTFNGKQLDKKTGKLRSTFVHSEVPSINKAKRASRLLQGGNLGSGLLRKVS